MTWLINFFHGKTYTSSSTRSCWIWDLIFCPEVFKMIFSRRWKSSWLKNSLSSSGPMICEREQGSQCWKQQATEKPLVVLRLPYKPNHFTNPKRVYVQVKSMKKVKIKAKLTHMAIHLSIPLHSTECRLEYFTLFLQ